MLHGGNLESLAKAHGQNKCFWGGIDTEVTLLRGDNDIIDKAVKDAIGALNCNNGLILSSTGLKFIPVDRILQMIESWKKHRLGAFECLTK